MNPFAEGLATAVMLLGAAVQGCVGFGSNLVAAPLLILIDPGFVPAPVIMASTVLNALVTRREKGAHHWEAMRVPIIAVIPGSLAAAVLVWRAGTSDTLTILFGLVILAAVALTASGLHLRRSRRNLACAGSVSGFMGTAVGIGGPPIALLFSNATGPEIRGALSRFFLVSAGISLVMLACFGQVKLEDLWMFLVLLPGTFVGYAISGWLAQHVDRGHVRIAVLGLSTISALVAIGRAVLS